MVFGFGIGYRSFVRKKKRKIDSRNNQDTPILMNYENHMFENSHAESEHVIELYFDRNKSAISLLGTFNVRDKDGKDITCLFSPRLKSFLILLILYSEKNTQGLLVKKIIDILWNEKDKLSARNNLFAFVAMSFSSSTPYCFFIFSIASSLNVPVKNIADFESNNSFSILNLHISFLFFLHSLHSPHGISI